jgi:hypothetical protein
LLREFTDNIAVVAATFPNGLLDLLPPKQQQVISLGQSEMESGRSKTEYAAKDPASSKPLNASSAFVLVTTEFLPIGLVSHLATDLRVSEGAAGLSVTTPGLIAALAGVRTGRGNKAAGLHMSWSYLRISFPTPPYRVAGYLKRGSPISSASGNKKPLIRAFALAAISEFP